MRPWWSHLNLPIIGKERDEDLTFEKLPQMGEGQRAEDVDLKKKQNEPGKFLTDKSDNFHTKL